MPFPNRYQKPCNACNATVAVNEGLVTGPPWKTYCTGCVPITPDKIIVRSADSAYLLKPDGYIGKERFKAYQEACAGCTYFEDEKSQLVDNVDQLLRIVDRLKSENFLVATASPDTSAVIQAHRNKMLESKANATSRLDEIDARLKEKGLALFPFQRSGVEWMSSRHAGLLADPPGLGKTVQTLLAIPDNAAVVVVCPAVARNVWKMETAKWRPDLRVSLLLGHGSFRWPRNGEVVVISYDVLPCIAEIEDEMDMHFATPEGVVLIGDEIHACKNQDSKRTINMTQLATRVRSNNGRCYLLSGTPLLNKPFDLWTVLSVAGLQREAYVSWKAFLEAFDAQPQEYGGYQFGTPTAAAGEGLKRVALRRRREDVLPDLPKKIIRDVMVDLRKPEEKELDRILGDIGGTNRFREQDNLMAIGEISTARAQLAKWKIPTLLSMIEDLEEQEEPIVVFSAHRAPVDALEKRPGWFTITGDTSETKRAQIVASFQDGLLKGIAATIQAGGVAITLTRASQAIFVDLDWTPALNEQAEDRLLRIGQTRGVIITRLIADHEIDKHVFEVLTVKQRRIEASVEAAAEVGD